MRQGAGAGGGGEGEAYAKTGAEGVEMGDGKGRAGGRKDRTGRPVDLNLCREHHYSCLTFPSQPLGRSP